jgi:hypothetical protein
MLVKVEKHIPWVRGLQHLEKPAQRRANLQGRVQRGRRYQAASSHALCC